MTAENHDEESHISVEEWDAMRKAIETREGLARYVGLEARDYEDNDHDGKKPQITLLREIADTLTIEDLFDGIGGEKLPETPTWQTLADVVSDALYHL